MARVLRFADAAGELSLPWPSLAGAHQHDNAGIAVAALRASGLAIPPPAFARGLGRAEWPGRMQRLGGSLAAALPEGWELWLDGAHNPGAGVALARHLTSWADRPASPGGRHEEGQGRRPSSSSRCCLLRRVSGRWPSRTSIWRCRSRTVVTASGGVARQGGTVAEALAKLAATEPEAPARVLVCGSLYLAGALLGRG